METVESRRLLSASLSTYVAFDPATTPSSPRTGVVQDAAGNVYGTTTTSPGGNGGGGGGTVYEIVAGTHAIVTLHTFDNVYGPYNDLCIDAAGNLYGSLQEYSKKPIGPGAVSPSADQTSGSIFKIAAGSHAFSTLATFTGSGTGRQPSALTIDAAGNLFGTTLYGPTGSSAGGTVFEVKAGSHTVTTLTTFNDAAADGATPDSGVVVDPAGNLYGTTTRGGANDLGTIFKVDGVTHARTTLATFDSTVGEGPHGLARDAAGDLFGVTYADFSSYRSVAFELPANRHTLTILATFDIASEPHGTPLVDAAGNLYGTATESDKVYKIAAGTHVRTTLVTFNTTSGIDVNPTLVADAAGNLYGTTGLYGPKDGGTVFKISGSGYVVTTGPSIVVAAPAAQTATPGVAKSFTLGSFTASHATAPYAVKVSWGDGTADTTFAASAAGVIAAKSHAYATAGSKTAGITVTDSAGHSSTKATFVVNVIAANSAGIAGTVYSDADSDGVKDAAEAGLAGVVVYLDADNDSVKDAGERSATTDASGHYAFTGLAEGTYKVRQIRPAGYTQTGPANNAGLAVTLTDGQAATGQNFGDHAAPGSIAGTVFGDTDSDGVFDPAELGLGLWTVYLDANRNGRLDSGETTATTDISGAWSFTGLAAGTYVVRVAPVAHTTATTATSLTVTLAAGQASTGKLFGEKRIA